MYRNEPGSRILSNLRTPDHLGLLPGKITISDVRHVFTQKIDFLSFGRLFMDPDSSGMISDDFGGNKTSKKRWKHRDFHKKMRLSCKFKNVHAKSRFFMQLHDFHEKSRLFLKSYILFVIF